MEIFLGAIFASCAIGALKMQLPEKFKILNVWRVVSGMILVYLSFWTLASSAVGYNDTGYCTHIRTFQGKEGATCDVGWYFSGWGETTRYPHFITVLNTTDKGLQGSSIEDPYSVRLADNWSARISQTTRFKLPLDARQFIKLARNFGSPEHLLSAVLRPAVNASLDSVASLYSLEEYYAGGKRDRFKGEFRDTVSRGMRVFGDNVANLNSKRERVAHSFQKYGISVDLAVMHSLHPDSSFVNLIKDRKHAVNKRILAKEKRLAEEEQHLLAIARQEIEIAKQKTEALIDQAKRITNAETEKAIGIITAEGRLEQTQIDIKTAHHALAKAEVDAETRKITAQADAFERKAVFSVDGGLEKKLEVYAEANEVWAEAFAKRAVPATFVGSGNSQTSNNLDHDAKAFMDLLTLKTARDLEIALNVETQEASPE